MSKSRKPFTHAVYSRFVGNKTGAYGWCYHPKLYRSERAARMAARDLDVAYSFACGRFEHIALPLPHRPGAHT